MLCTDVVWERHGDAMRAAAPDLDVVLLTGDDVVSEEDLARVQVAFFSGDAWPGRTRPLIGACLRAPNLRWLHTFSAGVDSPVFGMFLERGVRLTTSSGASATPIAHSVLMLILALARDLPRSVRAQQRHEWEQHVSAELEGSTLGVVGMGPIGVEVARLGQAFGMHVVGCRRTPTGDEPCETWTLARLPELVSRADWLVLALPLTPETRGILGSDLIAAMKPTARIINVGRGELVDEPALVTSLRDGRLAGAGLDVFAVEPLPDDSPLWDAPNVIVTPHIAGSTSQSHERAALLFVDNLRRFARQEPLRNEVSHR